MKRLSAVGLLSVVVCAVLCATAGTPALATSPPGPSVGPTTPPTVAQAQRFMENAEKELLDLWIRAGRADWVAQNFITDDTEQLSAAGSEAVIARTMELAREATRFDKLQLPADLARKMLLLKLSLVMPAPADPAQRRELTQIAASLQGDYGKGKYCPKPDQCWDLGKMEDILAESRNPSLLLEAWTGWRTISPKMRERYARFVALSNEGSKTLGFADTGSLWRSKYDMAPDAFENEMDRLWNQVRPLYDALHCYVRAKLAEKYGPQVVPAGQPIPAHLLGNMWAQEWGNIWDIVKPPEKAPAYDLAALLKARGTDEKEMVRYGERFFTGLGLAPLPDTFWERSLFKKPADRDVVCHASAWDLDYEDDLRIKMCIKINAEDFTTVHHELGHNYYQRAYKNQPPLFRDSANDGFHEALGDTLALSITPKYLVQIGLLDKEPAAEDDVPMLLQRALDKVAFLPFGLMMDKWRWDVFSGKVGPDRYNAHWWELIRRYQGIAPPVVRTEAEFDPGAKYHIPANTPYARYFLAAVLQFQFHRALCETAGQKGPLHRCTINGSKAAGERLDRMMTMGLSRPWPEALEALTGQKQMDATAILDYFAPLKTWLDEQNKGQKCGW